MKYPVVKFVFDRRKVATKKKTGGIELEITWQGVRKRLSTGVRVYKGEWNDRSMVVGRDDQQELNQQLNKVIGDLRKFYMSIADEGITWNKLDEFLGKQKSDEAQQSFIEFWEEQLVNKKGVKADSTLEQHRSVLNVVKEWGGIVSFADVTYENIVKFDEWLHSKGIMQGTVWNKHKVLRTYINDARKLGMIKNYPYDRFKLDKGKRSKIMYLEEPDVKRILAWNAGGSMVEKCRDLFVVQMFTGMAYKDLMGFDFKTIIERDGKFLLRDNRRKTLEEYFLVLMPPVMDVLKKYDFELPKISNVKYNEGLAAMGDVLGLPMRLRSHIGRHTFAVMMINHGIPISVVAQAMGHSTTKSTEIYAKILGKSVVSAFDALEKELKLNDNSVKN